MPACGVLVVDKPGGPTSHDVVIAVRRLLGERRVGHAGTLDPFATGVLVCCVGKATRLARFFSACAKTYEGVMRFGFATDSGDRTGRPLAAPVPVDLSLDVLRAAAARLSGEIAQTPPMFSAKKRDGVSLHRLARRGIEVARSPVSVRVDDWRLESPRGGDVDFRVSCSAGTYVRTLVTSLGESVGCPAHLAELRRTAAGPFSLADAHVLDALDAESAAAALVPLADVPLPLPEVALADDDASRAFAHGRELPRGAWTEIAGGDPVGGPCAVRDRAGSLLGVGHARLDGSIRPDVVLASP